MFKFILDLSLIFLVVFNFYFSDSEKIPQLKEPFQDKVDSLIEVDSIENIKDSVEVVLDLVFEKTYASWYGIPYHGRKSASGEIFNMDSLTCAGQVKITGKKGSGRKLEFGDILRITNLNNGLFVDVRVNDTGPLTKKRKIDLSKKAMSLLDGIYEGEIPIKVEKIYYVKK